MGLAHDRPRADGPHVVPIQRDVERAPRDRAPLLRLDQPGQALGELRAAAVNPHQHEAIGALGELNDLFCHALERPLDAAGIEESVARSGNDHSCGTS